MYYSMVIIEVILLLCIHTPLIDAVRQSELFEKFHAIMLIICSETSIKPLLQRVRLFRIQYRNDYGSYTF